MSRRPTTAPARSQPIEQVAPTSFDGAVCRLFVRLRRIPFFWRLTLLTRILMVAAFLPTGMVKLLGRRFTLLPVDNPVGAFFEAMYQTGVYWQFLGLSQVAAALLLALPATAHLGALLTLAITVNIFLITVGVGFTGTPMVTGPMLLAAVYLCAWDLHRFRSLWTVRSWPAELTVPQPRLDPVERVGFTVFAFCVLAFFGTTRFAAAWLPPGALVVVGAAAGLLALGRFGWIARRGHPGAA